MDLDPGPEHPPPEQVIHHRRAFCLSLKFFVNVYTMFLLVPDKFWRLTQITSSVKYTNMLLSENANSGRENVCLTPATFFFVHRQSKRRLLGLHKDCSVTLSNISNQHKSFCLYRWLVMFNKNISSRSLVEAVC
jgi:hypothetical protein